VDSVAVRLLVPGVALAVLLLAVFFAQREATATLSRNVRAQARAEQPHHGLNVSEHGMLIDGLALPIGAWITFLLAGRGPQPCRSWSRRSSHRHGRRFAVDLWHGAPEAIRALISGQTEPGPRVADTAYITDWS
jgi:hypothetical protein